MRANQWSPLLEKAVEIALDAHRGQRDKYDAPYLLHPLRMMCRADSSEAKIVAVLHDVVEDSDWTLDQLRKEGFPSQIIAAVDGLTRRDSESYEQFIRRAAKNPLARAVKLLDLADNMDVRRMPEIRPKDVKRLKKYRAAWDFIQNKSGIESGNKGSEPRLDVGRSPHIRNTKSRPLSFS